MSKKVKIAYALRPVVIQDESGKEIIVYEKFHPITTGNAVIVNGATLTNIVKDLYTKAEVDEMVANAIKVESVNGMTGAVLITAEAIGALTSKDITNKVDKVTGSSLVPDTKVTAYDSHLTNKNNPHEVTKAQVGLGNVDNTSDANKPVSTAQQTALNKKVDKVEGSSLVPDTKVESYDSHLNNIANPHEVTKGQVGLGNVDNTSDINKPVSTAQQIALDGKVDKEDGKGLSTEDFTTELKEKLNGLSNFDDTGLKEELDGKVDKIEGSSLVPDEKVSGYDAHLANKSNPHNVTKEQVGLGNVTNDPQVKRSEMGAANGVATLNESGTIPASQLPSFVDDVMEYVGKETFPIIGESGKVYIDISTNISYRWSGSVYVPIGSDLALGETSSTAYAGNKGKANADAIALLNGTIEQSGSIKEQIAKESTNLKNGVIKEAQDSVDALTARFDALGLYVDADGDICQID